MKKAVRCAMSLVGVGLLVLSLATGCGPAAEGEEASSAGRALAPAKSGMPNGAHFNLNLIGMDQPKSSEMTCGNGHVIFVPLTGGSKLLLSEGDFAVLDCNGTDGQASFQLPNPDPENDGVTTYSVWARALGKPGGSASMTPCATDPLSGELYCSLYSAVLVRSKGKSSFTNVSRELLYVHADLDGDGVVDRAPLFDSRLEDYFWDYQGSGLRLAQLRFYEVPTTIP